MPNRLASCRTCSPAGERNKLVAQLSEHFPQAAPLAAERALHKASRPAGATTGPDHGGTLVVGGGFGWQAAVR